MSHSREQRYLNLIAGNTSNAGAAMARMGLRCLEPLYASAMHLRNAGYNYTGGTKLPRPTVSIGNITTGGTGKTPVVEWLARMLLQHHHHPAILLRGYKSTATGSDEAEMLKTSLDPDYPGQVEIEPNRDRIIGANTVLYRAPETDVFILDDGFQHRRVARDLDIVLIDATNPFGYNHVLPRGLLREPLSGLARADVFILTHASQSIQLEQIEQTLRRYNPTAPLFRCNHRLKPF